MAFNPFVQPVAVQLATPDLLLPCLLSHDYPNSSYNSSFPSLMEVLIVCQSMKSGLKTLVLPGLLSQNTSPSIVPQAHSCSHFIFICFSSLLPNSIPHGPLALSILTLRSIIFSQFLLEAAVPAITFSTLELPLSCSECILISTYYLYIDVLS